MENEDQEKSEAKFLEALFKSLNESGLEYCVLRNYTSLPYSLAGSDLDLLVTSAQRDEIANLVMNVAERYGGSLIADYATTGRFMKFLGCYQGKWWGCAVDLLAGIDYRGMVYVSSEQMLERTKLYRNIRVAADCDVEVMALLKELVNNGKTRKDYLPNACDSFTQWGRQSLRILDETFSPDLISNFENLLKSKDGEAAGVKQVVSQLRSEIWRQHGLKNIPSLLKNVVARMKRLMNPPGFSMAVTGTDGAGKTTVINAISPILERSIHTSIKYEHMRPNWLKALGVAAGKREENENPVKYPHAQEASGLFGSLLRFGYYSLDYIVGYWVKVYPALVKRVNFFLFDRYYYDVLLDPRRMRICLPRWLMRMILSIAPQPQLVLCLGGEPEVIYQRKPETSLVEVKRQVEALKKLCQSNRQAVWVDTGCSLEESRDKALHEIQNAMSMRYK